MCQYCGNTGLCYLLFSAISMKLFMVIKAKLITLKRRLQKKKEKKEG